MGYYKVQFIMWVYSQIADTKINDLYIKLKIIHKDELKID